LTFWCSFCPSCRQVEQDLNALAEKYQGRAVVAALDASAEETAAQCRKVAEEKGLTLPILLDGGGRSADLFGTRTTTTTVVIDQDGALRYCGRRRSLRFSRANPLKRPRLATRAVPSCENESQRAKQGGFQFLRCAAGQP
jgi:peroxiredoxin